MSINYVIALRGNPVSYYDGGREGDPSRTCRLERAEIYSDPITPARKMKKLQKKYPNRSFELRKVEISIREVA